MLSILRTKASRGRACPAQGRSKQRPYGKGLHARTVFGRSFPDRKEVQVLESDRVMFLVPRCLPCVSLPALYGRFRCNESYSGIFQTRYGSEPGVSQGKTGVLQVLLN